MFSTKEKVALVIVGIEAIIAGVIGRAFDQRVRELLDENGCETCEELLKKTANKMAEK